MIPHYKNLMLFLSISLQFISCTQSSRAPKILFGEIEAEEIDLSSRVPSRIKSISVKLGQQVKAGDIVVEFEDDILAARRKGAQSIIALAENNKSLADNLVRPEQKKQAQAALLVAQKQLEFAKNSLDRVQALYKEGAVSQQTLDEVTTKHHTAQELFSMSSETMRILEQGARPEAKNNAEQMKNHAKTILEQIDALQKDVSLSTPIKGEVAKVFSHEGELVPMGYPVMTILKTDDLWVTLSIPEDLLADFPMGKEVTVTVPALRNNSYKGIVSYISAMANFATRNYTQSKSSFDLKTFEVRVTLTDFSKGMRPGMTAQVALNYN